MAKVNVDIIRKVQRFLTRLDERNVPVETAYIFGSYAKGIENRWSDIDVAIISSKFSNDRFEERIRLMKIASEIDSRIEPVPFKPDTFVDEDPLVWEIKKEGVVINA